MSVAVRCSRYNVKNIMFKPADELVAMLHGLIDKGDGEGEDGEDADGDAAEDAGEGRGEESAPPAALATSGTPRGERPKRKQPSVDTRAV